MHLQRVLKTNYVVILRVASSTLQLTHSFICTFVNKTIDFVFWYVLVCLYVTQDETSFTGVIQNSTTSKPNILRFDYLKVGSHVVALLLQCSNDGNRNWYKVSTFCFVMVCGPTWSVLSGEYMYCIVDLQLMTFESILPLFLDDSWMLSGTCLSNFPLFPISTIILE